jgi:hypothetical protein
VTQWLSKKKGDEIKKSQLEAEDRIVFHGGLQGANYYQGADY